MSRPVRHQQIVLLERTLTDYDFQPKTSTGSIVQRQAKSGELATAWVPCPVCGGDGERRVRTVMQPCDECKGRGVIKVDPYTRRRPRSLETDLHERVRWVRCDACGGPGRPGVLPGMLPNGRECRCAMSGRPGYVRAPQSPIRPWRLQAVPLSADAPELGVGDPVIACMLRRQLAGSYEELGLALGVLRLEQRRLYRLNVRVFIEAEIEEEELRTADQILLRESLHQLASMMPMEVRVPGWATTYERRRRERLGRREEAAA